MRAAVLFLFAACVRLPGPPAAEFARDVSVERLERTVRKLADFGTRHTASEGIVGAREWLKRQFEEIGGLDVTMQSFRSRKSQRLAEGVEIVNVVATLKGSKTPERVFVVSGHYDSRATDVMNAEIEAPGANDDASGVAVVLELARIFSRRTPESTIVFLCVAGEEQGLLGSRHFARQARDSATRVEAMFTNDIVGNTLGPGGVRHRDYIRVFSEGLPTAEGPMQTRLRRLGAEWDSPSRQLARHVEEAAARNLKGMRAKLVFRRDRFLRGGDHIAFNENGYAAVRLTEPFEDFRRQHRDVSDTEGDLPDHVDYAYLANVTKVNAVALFELANAPPAPRDVKILALKLENTTTLTWEPVLADDFSHCEVVWRDTTEGRWTHVKRVEGRDVTLPLSKDNWHFGVRAVDRDGNRSLVTYPTPKRR